VNLQGPEPSDTTVQSFKQRLKPPPSVFLRRLEVMKPEIPGNEPHVSGK
jgi:hypothetical protein